MKNTDHRVFIYIACTVFLILIGEGISKFIVKANLSPIVHHEVLGWTFARDAKYKIKYKSKDELVAFETNSFGFRKESSLENSKTLWLGGSLETGRYYPRSKTYLSMINSKLGEKNKIFDASVSAWATDQQYLFYLSQDFAGIETVVLSFSLNDIRESFSKKFIWYSDNEPKKSLIKISLKEKIGWKLSNLSYTFQALQKFFTEKPFGTFSRIFQLFPVEGELGNKKFDHTYIGQNSMNIDFEQMLEEYIQLILELNKSVVSRGASFYFIFTPTGMGSKWNVKSLPSYIYEKISTQLDRASIRYFDFHREFEEEQEKFSKGHFSTNGHDAYAQILLSRLYFLQSN